MGVKKIKIKLSGLAKTVIFLIVGLGLGLGLVLAGRQTGVFSRAGGGECSDESTKSCAGELIGNKVIHVDGRIYECKGSGEDGEDGKEICKLKVLEGGGVVKVEAGLDAGDQCVRNGGVCIAGLPKGADCTAANELGLNLMNANGDCSKGICCKGLGSQQVNELEFSLGGEAVGGSVNLRDLPYKMKSWLNNQKGLLNTLMRR